MLTGLSVADRSNAIWQADHVQLSQANRRGVAGSSASFGPSTRWTRRLHREKTAQAQPHTEAVRRALPNVFA